jgi:hypothetical protein
MTVIKTQLVVGWFEVYKIHLYKPGKLLPGKKR